MAPPKGESFAETAVKILQVSSTCAVAIAGNATFALEAVDMLRGSLPTASNIKSLLQSVTQSMDARCYGEDFDLLIADASNDDGTLLHWNCKSGSLAIVGERELVWIGSLQPEFSDELLGSLPLHVSSNPTEHALLLIATALFQSLLLRSLSVAQELGVGGIALSARVDAEGVHWPPDTNYVVADSTAEGGRAKFAPMDTVKVRVRNGGLAFASPHVAAIQCCLSLQNPTKWIERWAQEIEISMTGNLAQSWVFLTSTGSGAIIIHDDTAFDSCDAFKVVENNDGGATLVVKLDLKYLLDKISSDSVSPPFVMVRPKYVRQHFAELLRRLNFVPPPNTEDDLPQ